MKLLRMNRMIMAAILAAVMLLLAFYKMGMGFETNDDRCIIEMLAGTITQVPDAHVQVVNYLLAVPLMWLYRITWQIPWYGICLILFHSISWFFIFESILYCFQGRVELSVGAGLCGGLFLISLYTTGLMQFTSTAALMATAGYVCIILRQGKKGFWRFVCLEFLSFLLRSEAMLMIQPFGIFILIGFLADSAQWKSPEKRKLLYGVGIAIAGILVIGFAGTWMGYHHREWREYDKYNKARIALFDYYGTPEYEEVRDILDKYQVTETEYEAYRSYVITGGTINSECVEQLVSFMKNKQGGKVEAGSLLKGTLTILSQEDSLSCGGLVKIMWVCALIGIVISRRVRFLYPMLGLGIARTGVWCYLLFKGRILNRVSYPLFFCEIVCLLLIILCSYRESQRTLWQKTGILVISVIFIFNGYKTGQRQYRYVCSINEGQTIYIEGLKEVRNYCMDNPEKHFLLDNTSFSFYKGSVLETEIYKPTNAIYTGGWNGSSPVNREYSRNYCGVDWKDIYVIVYDDGNPIDVQATYITVRYFSEKTGRDAILEDRFSVSHGGSYIVWHF